MACGVWSAAIVRRYCSPVEPTFGGLVRVATVTIGFRRVGVLALYGVTDSSCGRYRGNATHSLVMLCYCVVDHREVSLSGQ